MSVRAYDPALGRFLSRDPLGRAPLFFADQPYVYGGNNPLINVDPSGQFMATEGISNTQAHAIMKQKARIYWGRPSDRRCRSDATCGCYEKCGSGGRNSSNGGGIQDWGEFAEGVLEVGGSFAALGVAIYAMIQGSGIPGWMYVLMQGVRWAGTYLIHFIHDGIKHIINGFGGHVTGWARVILDLIAVIGDIAVMAASGWFFSKAVMERGPGYKGSAIIQFFKKLGFILKRLGQGWTAGVFKDAADIMGPAIINIFGTAFAVWDDTKTMIGDIQTALAGR